MPPRTPLTSDVDAAGVELDHGQLVFAAVRIARERPAAQPAAGILCGWGRRGRGRARAQCQSLARTESGVPNSAPLPRPASAPHAPGPAAPTHPLPALRGRLPARPGAARRDSLEPSSAHRTHNRRELLRTHRSRRPTPRRHRCPPHRQRPRHRRPPGNHHLPCSHMPATPRCSWATRRPAPPPTGPCAPTSRHRAPSRSGETFATRHVRRLRYERPWSTYRLDIDGILTHDVRAPLRLEPVPGRLNLFHP